MSAEVEKLINRVVAAHAEARRVDDDRQRRYDAWRLLHGNQRLISEECYVAQSERINAAIDLEIAMFRRLDVIADSLEPHAPPD